MDYRCLYGHRIPTDFSFAIQQNACPRCGAPMVTVVGYQLARNLAAHVPLDAVDAFNTARYLEANYTLEARQEPVPDEVPVGEVEIDEAEVEHTETGVAVMEEEEDEERPTTLEAAPATAPAEVPAAPALTAAPTAVPMATAPKAAPKAAVVMPVAPVAKSQVEVQQEQGADAAVEQSDLTELERSFFAEG